MATGFFIIVGALALPVVVVAVRGFISGWRNHQPTSPEPEDFQAWWYDMIHERPKKQAKPTRNFRVVWPPKETK